MIIASTEKIIRHQNNLWQTRDNNNPAFKAQGQTEFTYENYNKLEEKAKDFKNIKWVVVDDIIKEIDKHSTCKEYHKEGILNLTCLDIIKKELLEIKFLSKTQANPTDLSVRTRPTIL